MILVTLGTFPVAFKRPLIEINRLCESGKITEEVIVQSGHTLMESPYMILKPFMTPDELTKLYESARIIVSHAGTGSLTKGIKMNKKVIAVARRSKYGEHVDDHQVEILDVFSELNYILPWRENDALEDILVAVDHFTPSRYISEKQKIIDYLTHYIDAL